MGAADEEAPPPLPGGRNYITRAGYERLAAELRALMREERPKIVEIVAWAAGNGDRSENGDYLYGKKRLREIDRRARFLMKRLEIAEIVDPSAQTARDRVFFGATVTLVDEAERERRLTIVGVDEADSDAGRISIASPLARALLGRRNGEEVAVRTPAGVSVVEILAVSYPPRAGS
jgi:transcription elongation factor GreB